MKKLKVIGLIVVVLLCASILIISQSDKTELKTIKSEAELLAIYNEKKLDSNNTLRGIFTMPFGIGLLINPGGKTSSSVGEIWDTSDSTINNVYIPTTPALSTGSSSSSLSKDYSTTNIQVENVDEADITKTDGDYIYSISNNSVIITNVKDPSEIKIESKISNVNGIPEDLILYNNKLVVISAKQEKYYQYNTVVSIYGIEDKSQPKLLKSYEMYEGYYTSRCINNELYVMASGYLRLKDNKIIRTYKEDNVEQEIELNKIHYLKNLMTNKQTLISNINLDDVTENVNISSYLINISNAYVSENSIYLLEQKNVYDDVKLSIKSIFGPKGIIGFFDYIEDNVSSNTYKTEIFKFEILQNGEVSYSCKNKVDGKTINQYSLDEQNNHLRMAVYDKNKGARVVIFNEKLKQIGASDYVASGEKMYSSRFMGDKAYLVTYRTMDPLFVMDLSDEENPKVLGELHIPGYSTYLHPYDENHLIGIGMETKETVRRDSNGKVISTTSQIVGMKMALFDVSDVNNPIQISQTVIGDNRTTSAILNNPKALLFSKEKQLIAIPVNNYNEEFKVVSNDDTYSSTVNAYSKYSKSYVAEGYFVYKVNLDEGFKLKGVITHETSQKTNSSYFYYYADSKLLRGLYIDNNLYTVSENAVKVNNLDTLEQISELKIK